MFFPMASQALDSKQNNVSPSLIFFAYGVKDVRCLVPTYQEHTKALKSQNGATEYLLSISSFRKRLLLMLRLFWVQSFFFFKVSRSTLVTPSSRKARKMEVGKKDVATVKAIGRRKVEQVPAWCPLCG